MTIVSGQNANAEDFVGNPAPFFSIESTAANTHSLTTVANQKVLVIAKGSVGGQSGNNTVTLAYNGVTKDSVVLNMPNSSSRYNFCLMYEEVPGADTQDVTVSVGGSSSINDPVIVVQKLLVG